MPQPFLCAQKSILVGLLTYAFGSLKTSTYLLCLPSFPVTDFRHKSKYSGTYSGGYRLGFSPNSLVHFPATNAVRKPQELYSLIYYHRFRIL